MNSDSVSVAFGMILEEIDSIVSEVNLQGAAFLRNNEYQKAKAAIGAGEKLAMFRSKLDTLNQEWVLGLDESTRKQINVESAVMAKKIASAPKSSKTILVVKFEDGTVLFESVAADTLVKVIKKFGVQRVIDMDLKVNAFPLVSKERSDTYSQTEMDGYLVMTHSNTEAKRDLILRIASLLNANVSVDIVPAGTQTI